MFKSTVINGNEVKFVVEKVGGNVYEMTFTVNDSLDRTVSNGKQHPGILKWVIKQLKEVCKVADEKELVLVASANEGDSDESLRFKAYKKYLHQVGPNQFIYGNSDSAAYQSFVVKEEVVDWSFLNA